jgi:hypothetical protein
LRAEGAAELARAVAGAVATVEAGSAIGNDEGEGGRLLRLSGALPTRTLPADGVAIGDEDGTEDEDCAGSVSGEPAPRVIAVGVARSGDGDVDEANTTRSRLAAPAPAPTRPAIGV